MKTKLLTTIILSSLLTQGCISNKTKIEIENKPIIYTIKSNQAKQQLKKLTQFQEQINQKCTTTNDIIVCKENQFNLTDLLKIDYENYKLILFTNIDNQTYSKIDTNKDTTISLYEALTYTKKLYQSVRWE